MTDKIKIFFAALLLFGVFAIGFMLLGVLIAYGHGCPQCPEITADTVAAIDSTVMGGTAVRPDADSLISVDSEPYPVPYPVYLPSDTVREHDTVYIILPYEHRLYEIPDTLKVWYSGIDPSVDSVMVYSQTYTITNTVNRDVFKMPRLTANVGAGAFYLDKSVNPYLVGQLRYNAAKTTFAAYGAIDHTGRWWAGLELTYRFTLLN